MSTTRAKNSQAHLRVRNQRFVEHLTTLTCILNQSQGVASHASPDSCTGHVSPDCDMPKAHLITGATAFTAATSPLLGPGLLSLRPPLTHERRSDRAHHSFFRAILLSCCINIKRPLHKSCNPPQVIFDHRFTCDPLVSLHIGQIIAAFLYLSMSSKYPAS